MSFPHKEKELKNLLEFLRGETAETQSGVARENQKAHAIAPPAAVKDRIRQKLNERAAAPHRAQIRAGRTATRTWLVPLAALALIGVGLGIYLNSGNLNPAPVQLSTLQGARHLQLRENQALEDEALRITAVAGAVEFDIYRGQMDHIFIRSGELSVAFDHARLKTDMWIHTPFATIVTEGTAFSVKTSPGKTEVHLHEGRIAVYSRPAAHLIKQVFEAPATIGFATRIRPSDDIPDFQSIEKEIREIGQKSKRVNMPPHRRVTLVLKNGDSVSGTIVRMDSTRVYVQSKHGLLTIEKDAVKSGL